VMEPDTSHHSCCKCVSLAVHRHTDTTGKWEIVKQRLWAWITAMSSYCITVLLLTVLQYDQYMCSTSTCDPE